MLRAKSLENTVSHDHRYILVQTVTDYRHLSDRYALNFKGAHYQTEWVELPEVTSLRKKLDVAPNRTLRDGTPFYTLPIIMDPAIGEFVGDSFEIALYLDKTHTDAPLLFPPTTVGLLAAFNVQVDAIFNPFVCLLVHGIPLNPDTAEVSRATFVERSGKADWESLTVRGEERAQTLEAFKAALGELAKIYRHSDGPFLDGNNATYGDLIVGGWLAFVKATLEEWEDVEMWHDGRWRKLHLALEKYAEVK